MSYYNNYIEMPAEILAQLGTNQALTRAAAFSHGCNDANGRHLFFCTMYGGKKYKTTAEQKEKAQELYSINKKKALENIDNKLVFVAMGCDYSERYPDDVCNHRIRTEILNPSGRNFFIEVGTGNGDQMRIDYVIDRDQEREYEQKAAECREKIQQAGGFWKIGKGHPLFEEYEKWQGQPYYWYKKEVWQDLKTTYTKANILTLVNTLFECNFSEIEIDGLHLTTDDYKSTSPQ